MMNTGFLVTVNVSPAATNPFAPIEFFVIQKKVLIHWADLMNDFHGQEHSTSVKVTGRDKARVRVIIFFPIANGSVSPSQHIHLGTPSVLYDPRGVKIKDFRAYATKVFC